MVDDNIFNKDDTTLYTSWEPRNGGIVIIHIPGVGEIRMTLAKAEEISADLARQAEYARWAALEKKHDEETHSESSRKRFWWDS